MYQILPSSKYHLKWFKHSVLWICKSTCCNLTISVYLQECTLLWRETSNKFQQYLNTIISTACKVTHIWFASAENNGNNLNNLDMMAPKHVCYNQNLKSYWGILILCKKNVYGTETCTECICNYFDRWKQNTFLDLQTFLLKKKKKTFQYFFAK